MLTLGSFLLKRRCYATTATTSEEAVKRGRGRPKKVKVEHIETLPEAEPIVSPAKTLKSKSLDLETTTTKVVAKRGRGRPKKIKVERIATLRKTKPIVSPSIAAKTLKSKSKSSDFEPKKTRGRPTPRPSSLKMAGAEFVRATFHRIDGNVSKLVLGGDDADLLAKISAQLWFAFKFDKPKTFFRRRSVGYWGKNWDNSVAFFHRKSGRFLTGLTPLIAERLEALGVEAIGKDKKSYEMFGGGGDASRFIDERAIDANMLLANVVVGDDAADAIEPRGGGEVLREYQVDLARAALRERRCLLKCATGGGKTLVFTALLKALPDKRAVVLVRSKALVEQIASTLRAHLPSVGRVSSDFFEPDERVVVSTIQSVHKIGEAVSRASVVIVDEVHEFASPLSIKKLAQFERADYRWGFSATPLKKIDEVHNHRLMGVFGPIACDVTTLQLTQQKILSAASIRFVTVSQPTNIGGFEWEPAETAGIVENDYMHRVVAYIVREQIERGRCLILVRRLQHGDRLSRMIPESIWVSGDSSSESRKDAIERLRRTDTDGHVKSVVIMSSIGNIGIDVMPHYLINCSGGGVAESLTIQKLGRGLRKGPDKRQLFYIDFLHETNFYLRKHSASRYRTLLDEGHEHLAIDTDTERLMQHADFRVHEQFEDEEVEDDSDSDYESDDDDFDDNDDDDSEKVKLNQLTWP
jgi:superfamily II DNA or RNA helicase